MEQSFEQIPERPRPESSLTARDKIFSDLKDLEEGSPITDAERSVFAEHLLNALREANGDYCTDVNDIYKSVNERVLVRRESPDRALHAIFDQVPIALSFKEGFGSENEGTDPYFNATSWMGMGDIPGLRNPFVEGFSHAEGVVTVLGFYPNEHVSFHHPKHTPEKMTNPTVAYDRDVSVSGSIEPEDIRFIIVRIPSKFITEDEMTPTEQELFDEGKLPFIFRGVLFNKNRDTSSTVSH